LEWWQYVIRWPITPLILPFKHFPYLIGGVTAWQVWLQLPASFWLAVSKNNLVRLKRATLEDIIMIPLLLSNAGRRILESAGKNIWVCREDYRRRWKDHFPCSSYCSYCRICEEPSFSSPAITTITFASVSVLQTSINFSKHLTAATALS